MTARQVERAEIGGREIFVSDNFIEAETALRLDRILKGLHYQRAERSRDDTPVSGLSAAISDELLQSESFFAEMRKFGEEMFPNERFEKERAYVNNCEFGDVYFPHRDCAPHLSNVTVLYYANLRWHADWGGETVFYDDKFDARVAVTPRPGRILAMRGAILHRGGMPTRVCYDQRLTIAYKLTAV